MIVSRAWTSQNPTTMPEPLSVTGVPVMPFETYDQALECVEEAIDSNRKSFWVAVNPIKIYNAWHTPELLNLLRQTDACFCDGVGVSIASRILNGRGINRITGCDLFFKLLARASQKQWGVYLLGGVPQSQRRRSRGHPEDVPRCEDRRLAGWVLQRFERSRCRHQPQWGRPPVRGHGLSQAGVLDCRSPSGDQRTVLHGRRRQLRCGGGHREAGARIFRATGTEFLFRFAMEPRKRLANQGILLSFLTQVIGRKLLGEGASVGGAYSHQ